MTPQQPNGLPALSFITRHARFSSFPDPAGQGGHQPTSIDAGRSRQGPPAAVIVVVGGGCAVRRRRAFRRRLDGEWRSQGCGDGASQTRLIETSR